jgi:hypothetical protein
VSPNQDIVRFDIAMQDMLIMGILKGRDDFFKILNNGGKWHLAPFGMTSTY